MRIMSAVPGTVGWDANGKSLRGFAAMSEEQRKRIASMGGKQAHQNGTAHQFSKAEAKAAGKKGGAVRANRSRNPPTVTGTTQGEVMATKKTPAPKKPAKPPMKPMKKC
jgi:general stress protein YciG